MAKGDRHVRLNYHWPEIQLNIWLIVVLAGSATCLGIFAWFMTVQSAMELGTPCALGVFFIFLVLGLIARQLLLPGILILGSFILFVLFLTGLIETSLQLYGVYGNVNSNCQNYVVENKSRGNNINTLAWLTQMTICEFFDFLTKPKIPFHWGGFTDKLCLQAIAGKPRSLWNSLIPSFMYG
ncbi:hypothetical protein N7490_004591 [Penicillium lividum]|nr:hypothetical protein N7490_004591 [Penicillium lividum]